MKKFVLLAFLLINFLYHCNTHESGGEEEPKCCNNVTNQQIVVEFTSTVVEHEYIIHFKEYLSSDERKQHINAALSNHLVNKN
jgi:hypothetical protein